MSNELFRETDIQNTAILNDYKATLKSAFNAINSIARLAEKKQRANHDNNFIDSSSVNGRVQHRRYTLQQTSEMINVDPKLISYAEVNGLLPTPNNRTDTKQKIRSGYTVNQINHMRSAFGKRPTNPNSDCPIVSFMNLKGGSTKTTTCLLFSQYLAIKGFRVLIVDSDPQGTLSTCYGKTTNEYIRSIVPFMNNDDVYLRQFGFDEGSASSLHYAIQKTYWTDIDIISSCLDNQIVEILINNSDSTDPRSRLYKLRTGLEALKDRYDYILIDGTPSVSNSTNYTLMASDKVFVPVPPSYNDIASTNNFHKHICELISPSASEDQSLPNPFSIEPRDLPDIRYFLAKHDRSKIAHFYETVFRHAYGKPTNKVLDSSVPHSNEIQKASGSSYTIYEQNPSESTNPRGLRDICAHYNALFDEMSDHIFTRQPPSTPV